jgi:hypothetical protein
MRKRSGFFSCVHFVIRVSLTAVSWLSWKL